jgi:hypothetical protein
MQVPGGGGVFMVFNPSVKALNIIVIRYISTAYNHYPVFWLKMYRYKFVESDRISEQKPGHFGNFSNIQYIYEIPNRYERPAFLTLYNPKNM